MHELVDEGGADADDEDENEDLDMHFDEEGGAEEEEGGADGTDAGVGAYRFTFGYLDGN